MNKCIIPYYNIICPNFSSLNNELVKFIVSYSTESDYAPSFLHFNLIFVPKSINFKSLMYFHSKMIKIKEAESLSATTEIINLSSARLLFPR